MEYLRKDGIPICSMPGVYSITNRKDGKCYIGSTLSLRGRMVIHRAQLRKGKHDNSYLQRAWDKYGEQAFRFDIVELSSPDTCYEREQYYIEAFEACVRSKGYNLALYAGRPPMIGRKHSKKSKAKMSASQKGRDMSEVTRAAAIANTGQKKSAAFCQRVGDVHRGKVVSEETRKRLSETHWTKQPGAAELIAKIAAKNRGKKLSEEHKRKISKGGRRAWRGVRRGIMHATTA